MSQEAAIEALDHCAKEVEDMRNDYQRRRNFVVSRLNEIGLPCHSPKGTFYVFPDIRPTKQTSRDFCLALLKEMRVAVVPGSAFGESGEGFVRCCFATSLVKLQEAMNRIETYVNKVRA
jgi:aminotransferase